MNTDRCSLSTVTGVRPSTIILYAWLVNSAGPLDGRRDARPRLFPASGRRLPGAERLLRHSARPGIVYGAGGCRSRARDGAAAGGRMAGIAVARHSSVA